jgi:hypothetical protein
MANKPTREFGKRRPSVPAVERPGPPTKRSGQVALLLMGTFAVGSAAYTLLPSNSCERSLHPALQDNADCPPQRSSWGSSHGSYGGTASRSRYYYNGSSPGHSGSGTSYSGSSHTTRGGFGSFAHAFGFSGHS